MSALAAIFSHSADAAPIRGMLAAMADRGADEVAVWSRPGAAIGVSRYAFEAASVITGRSAVAEQDGVIVVADASLYYRGDLSRALGRSGDLSDATPAQLILEVYRAFGADGIARLEGDFAFALFDGPGRTVLCGRDIIGRRPLHYACESGTLIVASTTGGVGAHPLVTRELNVAAVAETAAGIFDSCHETVFSSIHSLPAGALLVWREGQATVRSYWQPGPVDTTGAAGFDEAAAELRELLVAAVAERLDDTAPTSVWLSGGWDSPAVFAAGEEYVRRVGGEGLRPISISYPEGDPGREDELIASVLERWGRSAHWIDIDQVPFLVQPAAEAKRRDEPFVHAFEHWLRALARGSRARQTSVALDGTGGDLLFSASLLYMADLLRRGRIGRLRREWQGKGLGGSGLRKGYDVLVHPLLPGWLRQVGRALRPRRSWAAPFETHVPDWIRPDFARRYGLLERARRNAPPPAGQSLADAELHYYLTHPTGARLVSAYTDVALSEGVEVRSPLYDRRIIDFAVRRPLAERTQAHETKRLLRKACEPWLPAAFLAPRPHRTGGTGAYAHRSLRGTHAALVSEVLSSPLLAEMGIVDPAVLAWRWQEFMNGISRYELPLYLTFQTELWLRAHHSARGADAPAPPGLLKAYA